MKKIFLILLLIWMGSSVEAQISMDDHQFSKLINRTLDSLYDAETDFAGATVGVVLPDGQAFAFAAGLADEEKNIKMTHDTRMLGGSTGKIFVSASVMQLVGEGKIDLDGKMADYLSDYDWISRVQNGNEITVRNLMQHATGISRYVFEEDFQAEVIKDADRVWQPAELVSYVLDQEPLFAAGSDFAYADTNYILLAMILEEVSGQTMYDYVQENILTPFALSTVKPQVSRKMDKLASGYNRPDDPFFPGKTAEDGVYKYNVQFEWAGGGFTENAVDLAKAGKLIYEGKVFPESLMDEFLSGVDAKQLGGTWGLGVHIHETPMGMTYGHSGFFPGYITNMLYFPEYGFSVAFQVNTSDGSKINLYRKLYQLVPVIQDYLSE